MILHQDLWIFSIVFITENSHINNKTNEQKLCRDEDLNENGHCPQIYSFNNLFFQQHLNAET